MYGQLDAEAVWSSPNSSIKSNAISQDCIVVEHASIFIEHGDDDVDDNYSDNVVYFCHFMLNTEVHLSDVWSLL